VESILANVQDELLLASPSVRSYEMTESSGPPWKSSIFLVSAILFVGAVILAITLL
jgi:hypothetical protein